MSKEVTAEYLAKVLEALVEAMHRERASLTPASLAMKDSAKDILEDYKKQETKPEEGTKTIDVVLQLSRLVDAHNKASKFNDRKLIEEIEASKELCEKFVTERIPTEKKEYKHIAKDDWVALGKHADSNPYNLFTQPHRDRLSDKAEALGIPISPLPNWESVGHAIVLKERGPAFSTVEEEQNKPKSYWTTKGEEADACCVHAQNELRSVSEKNGLQWEDCDSWAEVAQRIESRSYTPDKPEERTDWYGTSLYIDKGIAHVVKAVDVSPLTILKEVTTQELSAKTRMDLFGPVKKEELEPRILTQLSKENYKWRINGAWATGKMVMVAVEGCVRPVLATGAWFGNINPSNLRLMQHAHSREQEFVHAGKLEVYIVERETADAS